MKKSIFLIFVAAALAFVAASCQNPFAAARAHATGRLDLSAGSSASGASRSILPAGMTPASYKLTGSGPSGASVAQDSTNGSFTLENIAAGDWSLSVQGLDSAKNAIVSGSITATVKVGATTSASIKLAPVSTGTGSLALTVDWSGATKFSVDSVSGSLASDSGSTTALTFAISGTAASCSQTGLATGSYLLTLTAIKSGIQVARTLTETVLIYNGQTSSGTVSIGDADCGYRIIYNVGSASSGTVPTDANIYATGAQAALAANTGALSKSSYSFVGWNTVADGSGTTYAPGATVAIGSANLNLYPKWGTIVYDANGATSGAVPISPSYYSGQTVTVLGNTGGLAKTGYIYAGWNTKADGSGTSYVAGGTFTQGSDITTLYAKWTPTYTVTYDGNGATGGSAPVDHGSYQAAATVTVLGNSGALTRADYVFTGWNTKADCSGTQYAAGATFAIGAADTMLYARWTPKFASVSCGGTHTLGVTTKGALWGWGNNSSGQLGVTLAGSATKTLTPVKIYDSGVKAAWAVDTTSSGWSFILMTSGDLYACGYSNGALGSGSGKVGTSVTAPTIICDGVASVSASATHTLILKSNGDLYACGLDSYGELGDGKTATLSTPTFICSGVSAASAGNAYSLILKSGALYACGYNCFGQCASESTSDLTTLTIEQSGTAISSICAGGAHSLFLTSDGALKSCGGNYQGSLGNATTSSGATTGLATPTLTNSRGIASMAAAGFINRASGSSPLYYGYSMLLMNDGTLCASGYNYYGVFGDGTTTSATSFKSVASDVAFVSVADSSNYYTGYYFENSAIIKTDGSLWMAGINGNGLVGDGTTNFKTSWTQVCF